MGFFRCRRAGRALRHDLNSRPDTSRPDTVLSALPAFWAQHFVRRLSSLAGYDDLDGAAAIAASLTSVHQDVDRIAASVLAKLLNRIDGTEPSGPIETTIPVQLLTRNSTGPAPDLTPDPNAQHIKRIRQNTPV